MDIQEEVQKAKQGSQKAYSLLLDFYWSKIYGYLKSKTLNDKDTEDLTIGTFSRAFDRIDSYDRQYDFGNWLMTIAKNLHIDFIRSSKKVWENHKNSETHKILDETPTAEDDLIQEQDSAHLMRILEKLKPDYQNVIRLRYFDEMSYAEISEATGESLSNVKVKVLRAKKLLAFQIKKGTN